MDFAPPDLNARLHPERLLAANPRFSGGEFPVPNPTELLDFGPC